MPRWSTAVARGSIPGLGTKIPQAVWHSLKKKAGGRGGRKEASGTLSPASCYSVTGLEVRDTPGFLSISHVILLVTITSYILNKQNKQVSVSTQVP